MTVTRRQRDVLAFIGAFIRRELVPPTLREVCSAFGFASTNAAMTHLYYLRKKEFVTWQQNGKSRDVRLTESAWALLGYSRCDHCGSLVEPGKAVA